MQELYVSPGNTKLGNTKSVSLIPRYTCNTALACHDTCYAERMCRFRKNIDKSWTKNTLLWINNPGKFEDELCRSLYNQKSMIPYFRWHVGGDIPSIKYFEMMCRVSIKFSDMKDYVLFTCFTKKYEYIRDISKLLNNTNNNLIVNLSIWPSEQNQLRVLSEKSIDIIRENNMMNIVWIAGDNRIETLGKSVYYCTGFCPTCRRCWRPGSDIVLKKH